MEKVAFLINPRLRIALLTAKDVPTGCVKKYAGQSPSGKAQGRGITPPSPIQFLFDRVGWAHKLKKRRNKEKKRSFFQMNVYFETITFEAAACSPSGSHSGALSWRVKVWLRHPYRMLVCDLNELISAANES